jgi:transposase
VRSFLKADPLSGNLFVFRNRGGRRVKVLWWDTEGLVIYYKRLEQGAFRWPRSGEVALEITAQQLLRLLSGLEVAERRAG